jgi:mono/diheme cytochrome c family protein
MAMIHRVMAGFMPAIHVLLRCASKDVDARFRGHDGKPSASWPAFSAGMTSITIFVLSLLVSSSPTLAAEPSADDIDQGRALYDDNCSSCHGRDMVTSGVAAFDLRRFPKDDESRFRNSVLAGKGGMPAWRDKLSDADLQLLWAYVRSGG